MNKIVALVLTVVFGLFFLAFGVYGVAMEFKVPPVHTVHLAFFLFLVLLGAVLMPGVGTIILGKLKDGVDIAGPFIPRFGGRRDYDPVVPAPDPHVERPALPPEKGEVP